MLLIAHMTTRRDVLRSLTALGFGAAPALTGCGGASTNGRWFNAVRSDGITPARYSTPVSAREIVLAVQEAEARGGRVRMTGSGHSFSDVAMTADHMMSPRGLTTCAWLDRSRLCDEVKEDRHLVRVQSGSTLHQLDRRLEAVGLAFANLGGYDAQTVVGAASTGTHGSGLGFGPITEQIVSWQVVTAGGKVVQIEPSAGITDPARFPGTLEDDPSIPVTLRQDDDLFHAMGVGIGCLGIAYAVVLKAVDEFWLREVRTLTGWKSLSAPDGFLGRLVADEGRSLPPDLHHYEIYFNPYPARGEHAALLTERYHLGTRPTLLSTRRGNPGAAWDAGLTVSATDSGVLSTFVDLLSETAARDVITGALQNLVDPGYTQASYRVFNLGDLNRARAYGIELSFPIARTVEVVARVFDIASRQAEKSRLHPSPISLRFVQNSPFLIAPQQGRTTTMLEMGVAVGQRGADELLRTYEEELVRDFGVRPHWGLDLRVLRGDRAVRALWPDTWDKWLTAFRTQNASGVFDGEVTDRLGISMRPRT